MTQDDLDAIRQRVALTTPGSWQHHYHDATSLDELGAFFVKALSYAPDRLRIELVTTGGPDDDGICSPDTVTIAITGNGPRSVANAEFCSNARQDVLLLLGEVAAWRKRFADLAHDEAELIAENERLRAALVQFADRDNWIISQPDEYGGTNPEWIGDGEACEIAAATLRR